MTVEDTSERPSPSRASGRVGYLPLFKYTHLPQVQGLLVTAIAATVAFIVGALAHGEEVAYRSLWIVLLGLVAAWALLAYLQFAKTKGVVKRYMEKSMLFVELFELRMGDLSQSLGAKTTKRPEWIEMTPFLPMEPPEWLAEYHQVIDHGLRSIDSEFRWLISASPKAISERHAAGWEAWAEMVAREVRTAYLDAWRELPEIRLDAPWDVRSRAMDIYSEEDTRACPICGSPETEASSGEE